MERRLQIYGSFSSSDHFPSSQGDRLTVTTYPHTAYQEHKGIACIEA